MWLFLSLEPIVELLISLISLLPCLGEQEGLGKDREMGEKN